LAELRTKSQKFQFRKIFAVNVMYKIGASAAHLAKNSEPQFKIYWFL